MKLKKFTAAIAAIAMTATMSISALSASAADYDVPADDTAIVAIAEDTVNYTSSAFYSTSSGNPAPMGMDTLCIDSTTTDSNGNVKVKLKEGTLSIWSWNFITATITSCKNTATGTEYFNTATSDCPYGYILIPASDISTDSNGGYVDVTVSFGGSISTIIALTPMSNPMELRLRLFT